MSDYGIRKAFGIGQGQDDDLNEDGDDLSFDLDSRHRHPDDGVGPADIVGEMARLMDTITRVGGEVCRLRAEMDGMIDFNKVLGERFDRLREVIEEKGTLDLDDFELACEVMNHRQGPLTVELIPSPNKKIAH